jgi:predicted amidohydrolase
VRVGFAQFCPVFGAVDYNISRTTKLVGSVSCDLIVLPELCTSGYNFSSRDEVARLAEPVPDGPACAAWRNVARQKGCCIVAGIAEKNRDGIFNSAVLVRPDGTVSVYRKVHLFDHEKQWFAPGDGFAVYDIGPARIGLMVCFDWIFPESARTLALAGADIICHPANLVLPWCGDAMITRCIENRVFAITANRYGIEDRGDRALAFTGGSQVVGPDGSLLARAGCDGDSVSVVDIDPVAARNKRINGNNDLLADRRPECYGLLARLAEQRP